jgi:hypothetical protein
MYLCLCVFIVHNACNAEQSYVHRTQIVHTLWMFCLNAGHTLFVYVWSWQLSMYESCIMHNTRTLTLTHIYMCHVCRACIIPTLGVTMSDTHTHTTHIYKRNTTQQKHTMEPPSPPALMRNREEQRPGCWLGGRGAHVAQQRTSTSCPSRWCSARQFPHQQHPRVQHT